MIEDVFRELTFSKLHDGRDTQVHYEPIGTSKSKTFNKMRMQTLDDIRPQGNKFSNLSCPSFRNILTIILMQYLREFLIS